MKINWKVRLKNPVWWAEVLAAFLLPVLAAVGLRWEDMTNWNALFEVLKAAVQNPVTVCSVAVSLWNTVTDPTTAGFSDSSRALTYNEPGE